MDRQKEYVLRTVEERGVRLVRLWFTDVLGQLKSFAISPAELENAFEEGMQFDGSAIDGFSRIQESDVLARPDARTFELLPWDRAATRRRPACSATSPPSTARRSPATPARCCGATSTPPASGATRSSCAPEIEFFYFGSGDPTKPPRAARHRLATSTSPPPTSASDLRKQHHPPPRGHGHPGGVLVPRGQPQPARDRPALHRRAVAWPTTS